jgi:hypothetical protein
MIQVEPEGEFPIEPDRILDRRYITLRNRAIEHVKVKWRHLSPEEAMWEMEDHTRKAYPFLF